MTSDHSPRLLWVLGLPEGAPDKDALADLVDASGGTDEAENEYYEVSADPQFVQIEREQRRYRGAFLRRVRRDRPWTAGQGGVATPQRHGGPDAAGFWPANR